MRFTVFVALASVSRASDEEVPIPGEEASLHGTCLGQSDAGSALPAERLGSNRRSQRRRGNQGGERRWTYLEVM